jgi:bifunctional non-homologous end joining protein LigD
MAPRSDDDVLEVAGRAVRVTNLGKVLCPRSGFRKGDALAYYAAVAGAIVPQLAGRPLAFRRYPDGVDRGPLAGDSNGFEKDCPPRRPEWMRTTAVAAATRGAPIDFCVVDDAAALLWLANLAALELHVTLGTAAAPERPTAVVFDLDPGPPAGLVECAEVALVLRGLFDGLGLRSFAKASGGAGLHVHVPLNGERASFEGTRPWARAVAEALAAELPELVVAEMARERRHGRVYVDWSQNDRSKSTVCAYSLRAHDPPTVAAPLAWDEVERAAGRRDPAPLVLGPDAVAARLRERGDEFAAALSLRQELPG